jgi:glycosyltransferase involved in cell wall biosynthesis
MKIAVLDYYNVGTAAHKDSITTPLVLKELGHTVELLSCDPAVTAAFDLHAFCVKPAGQLLSRGWERGDFDCAIAISRFDHSITNLLSQIKAAGLPLVVKGDTDGTLGFPLRPNYLRIRPMLDEPVNTFRHLKWRLPIRRWVGRKLEHVALADRIVVESPGAAANLGQVLDHWGLGTHLSKVRFIPNQVAKEVVEAPIPTSKPRAIVSAGRWDDARCKGADLLAPVVRNLLHTRDDYSVTIVGSGVNEVRRRLGDRELSRVKLLEEIDFPEVQKLIFKSRIALVPSRLESFSFVSAEAVCGGASLVVTPIESLTYLAGGGIWGTVARDFSVAAITAALLSEIERWEVGQHCPEATSRFWRGRLAPGSTAVEWSKLLAEIVH